jgi:hypothetical protein
VQVFTFLSPAWLEQLTAAAGGGAVGPGAAVVQLVVTGGPDGDVGVVLELEPGCFRARPGRDPQAVLTLTQSWETAWRIHRGELSAPEAFRAGLVKVRGDAAPLVELATTLGPLGPAVAPLREQTVDA